LSWYGEFFALGIMAGIDAIELDWKGDRPSGSVLKREQSASQREARPDVALAHEVVSSP